MKNTEQKRRSGIKIMSQLIILIKPLLHIMFVAILLGVIGFLCSIFLTILAGEILLKGLPDIKIQTDLFAGFSIKAIAITMVALAVLRGAFRYIEQYCNHFIAFKLLAIIRHKIFVALRKLCPAKLEGRDKGNLISIITTDIELLEVFYAHTISPIIIGILTSVVMVIFIAQYNIYSAILATVAYIVIGALIPLYNGKRGKNNGMEFRTKFGGLNSFVLDSLRGLYETIQYNQGKQRQDKMDEYSDDLSKIQGKLSKIEASQRASTNSFILIFSIAMLFLNLFLYSNNMVGFDSVLICTITMMGSFGPVVALSNLSNNLSQTLASGERVLSILEEKPQVEEVLDKNNGANYNEFTGAQVDNISFSYDEAQILKDYSITIPKNKIVGILGRSGCGKSTLLKLLMRFWDVQSGEVRISNENVKNIPTSSLRQMQSYVTQETHLFNDTIANNIGVAKQNATREEIIESAKKASIHDFIMELPNGYDTNVGELGEMLSGGERQRIGIARAFLHDAPFVLLDEPTSNLDSLNEAIILKSLKESSDDKTVVLVSHRKSTMNIADMVIDVN